MAVRINCPDAKRKDIDEAIKYWLKKGPSRLSRANVGKILTKYLTVMYTPYN